MGVRGLCGSVCGDDVDAFVVDLPHSESGPPSTSTRVRYSMDESAGPLVVCHRKCASWLVFWGCAGDGAA